MGCEGSRRATVTDDKFIQKEVEYGIRASNGKSVRGVFCIRELWTRPTMQIQGGEPRPQ